MTMATTTETFFPPATTVYVVENNRTCIEVGKVISYSMKAYNDSDEVLTFSREYTIKFDDMGMVKNVKDDLVFDDASGALTEINNNL